MSTLVPERAVDFDELRDREDLDVFTSADPGYDSVRATWNTAVEHHPTAVIVPIETSGVVAAVEFARARGLSVAVQSTGHGPTRAVRDAVLINMARMNSVDLDLEARTAVVGGGAKWQAVLDVIVPHGLAPLLGSTPDVSAVGYTLGGGLGWLARKYGTSADSVHEFELVNSEALVVRASPDENADLFWALRGGGAGNLGVVTSMKIQLYPIPEVYGGDLFYPAEMAGEVLRRWRDWIESVPEDLTSGATLLNFPPTEDVPEEWRGKSFVIIRGAFDGPADEGERLLAHWREWREPAFDLWGLMPFERIADISMDPLDPFPNEGTGLWLGSLSDASIDALVEGSRPSEVAPMMVQTEMRHAGGALARGGSVPAAFGNRDAKILLELVGWAPTPEDGETVRHHIDSIRARISPDLTGGIYLNYAEGDERRFGAMEGLGEAGYRRLATVKSSYDPDDLFDHGVHAAV